MKKAVDKQRRKLPSREKYEKKNPTVSARVSTETRDKLRQSLAKLGMSLSEALRVLAGELEIKAIPIEEARKKGYEEARDLFMVTYPCSVCGKPIVMTTSKEKESASLHMKERGWAHGKCHEQRGKV